MRKLLFIIFLCFANLTFAQECFTFDSRPVDCLNKWVILPQNEDLSYSYGYVFFDEEFNLIFQKEGTFEIEYECYRSVTKLKKPVKTTIEPSNTLVAVISEDNFSDFEISNDSPSLKNIKKAKENAETFFRLGYLYNEWGESDKALEQLLKAQEKNPKVAGLDRELAFTYNSLGNYDEAIKILYELKKKYPKDAYIYREMVFALAKTGKLKEAVSNFRHAVSVCKDKKYNGENILNIVYAAFMEKDEKTFFQWVKKSKQLNKNSEKALNLITQMEDSMRGK